VDIDCFFLQGSVHTLRPDLIGDEETPMVVAWGETGEISCANYAARALGLRAGMRFNDSDRRKPENVLVLSYCFDAYMEFATNFYEALFELTDHVIGSSCDEAYLDVTNGLKLEKDKFIKEKGIESENASVRGEAMAKFIQKYVTERCKLKCSVGAGPNKLIAKCATSKYAKPNGMSEDPYYYVSKEYAPYFMAQLAVEDVPGVGHVLFRKLREENIRRCADLQAIKEGSREFMQLIDVIGGDVATYNLIQKARGIDDTEWKPDPPPQTTSMKISWGVRFETRERVLAVLKDMSKTVCDRAKMLGDRRAKSITFEIMLSKDINSTQKKGFLGHGPCTEYSRSKNLVNATNDYKIIHKKVREILDDLNKSIHFGIEIIRGLCVRLHFENNTGSPAKKNPKKRGLVLDTRGPAQGLIGPQSKVYVRDRTQPSVNTVFMQLTKKQKAENEKHGIMERQSDKNDIKTNIVRENEEGTGGEEVKEAATAPFYIEKEFNVIEHLFATHSRRLAVEMHRVRRSDEFKYNAPGQEQVIAGLATECACSLASHVRAAVDAIKKQYVYKEDIKEFLERVKNLARWHEEMLFTSNGVEVFVGTWKRVCDEVY
jgi:nucleotidyltransferase/DNA polymerase involved in DNA repair